MKHFLPALAFLIVSSACAPMAGVLVSPTPGQRPAAAAFNATWFATPGPNLNPSLFPSPVWPPLTPGITRTPTPFPTFTPAPPTVTPTPYPTPAWPAPPITSSSYIPREVLSVAVGSGPGQIGIKSSDTGPQGPRSFAVGSDGSVRILDSVNGRLNSYGPQGAFVDTITFPPFLEPVDVAVDDSRDTVAVVDGTANVYLFDRTAPMRIYTSTFSSNAVRFLSDGTLAAHNPAIGAGTVIQVGTSQEEYTAQQKEATKEAGMLYRDGSFMPDVFRRGPDGSWGVYNVRLHGRDVTTLSVPLRNWTGPERPVLMEVSFLDTAAAGNFYLKASIIYSITPSRHDTWILRYDPKDTFVTVFQPASYVNVYAGFVSRPNLYRVMPNGDIYVLEPFQDRVKVVKWEYRPVQATPVATQLAPWEGTAETQGIIAAIFMNGYSIVLPDMGLTVQDGTIIHRPDGSDGKMTDLVTGMTVRARGITGRGIPLQTVPLP